MQRAFLLILFILPLQSVYAQAPYIRRFTQDDGLPGELVYKVLQDHEGFIWICTFNGVVRYNGNRFQTFKKGESGFPDHGAFYAYLDKSNRVWFITFSGFACYFENGRFHPPPFTHPEINNIKWVCEDQAGNLYFSTSKNYIFRWDTAHHFTALKTHIGNVHMLAVLNDSTLIASVGLEYRMFKNFRDTRLIPVPLTMNSDYSRPHRIADNNMLFSTSKGIYQMLNNQVRLVIPKSEEMSGIVVSYHTSLQDSTLLLGTQTGLYKFSMKEHPFKLLFHLEKNKAITSICTDRDNHIWFTSYGEGVSMIYSENIKWYEVKSAHKDLNNFEHVFSSGRGPIFINNVGNFYTIQSNRLKKIFAVSGKEHTFTFNVLRIAPDEFLLSSTSANYRVRADGKVLKPTISPFDSYAAQSYTNSKNEIYILGKLNKLASIHQYQQGMMRQLGRTILPFVGRPLKSFAIDEQKRCWIGDKNGVMYYRIDSEIIYLQNRFPELNTPVVDIKPVFPRKIWLATLGNGLFCLDGEKLSIIKHITTTDGLANNICSKICPDNDGALWVLTAEGVDRISDPFSPKLTITHFTKNNLLPSYIVRDIMIVKDTVYLATGKGVIIFNRRDIPDNNIAIPTYITGMSIAGKDTQPENGYQVRYGVPVTFSFSSAALGTTFHMQYQYRLQGLDTQWVQSNTDNVSFNSLEPGDYVFAVRNVNGDNTRNSIASISFSIPPAYWQTGWFRLLIVLATSLLMSIILYAVMRSRNRKNILSRMLAESELRSLRSQINPHFIFNSLNSIQDFIIEQQPREANDYLGRFAQMMRMIIENSKKEFIPLQDEIEFINLYVSLEQLRFGNTFTYTIEVSSEMDLYNVMVPPLIVQPIVENAIKHGLSGKKGNKQLSVTFRQLTGAILCTVEDNGIGRDQAARYNLQTNGRKKTHMGIENSATRLELIYTGKINTTTKPYIVIKDMKNESGNATGTIAEITFPDVK